MKKPDWLSLFSTNIESMDRLPSDWHEQIRSLARSSATKSRLDASSPTSLEEEGTVIFVDVVHGEQVKDNIQWLFDLYEGPLLEFAGKSFGEKLFPCLKDEDAININVLSGNGGRYEWHCDTNPVTGLLFIDNFDESDGGALVFKKNNEEFRVYPKRGLFLCFDARDVPHRVEPITSDQQRISAPMNYYLNKENSGRSEALSQYLRQSR